MSDETAIPSNCNFNSEIPFVHFQEAPTYDEEEYLDDIDEEEEAAAVDSSSFSSQSEKIPQ